jgi:hypothetical protein
MQPFATPWTMTHSWSGNKEFVQYVFVPLELESSTEITITKQCSHADSCAQIATEGFTTGLRPSG